MRASSPNGNARFRRLAFAAAAVVLLVGIMALSQSRSTNGPSAADPSISLVSTVTATFVPKNTEASATSTVVPPTATTVVASPTSTRTVAPTLTARVTSTATPVSTAAATPTAVSPTATALALQPCPAEVHDQYTALGPDGVSYPTWHPSVDPVHQCSFGHEHGDDPNGSLALRGRTVLFGYASIKAGMQEPHIGFKVFRWDNIQSTYGPSHDGASYLAVLHQGTSGAGRFTTVFHDVEIHYYQPADGREVHVHMLAPFGTLKVGCGANDPLMELNVKQADAPGARVVSSARCFAAPNIPYEDWITALYVGGDGRGSWRAYLDPHFAVFEPNTFCTVEAGACTLGYSDAYAGTGYDPAGVSALYKGSKRETYLNQVWLRNSGGNTSIWTDPFGKAVTPGTPNAIEQFVASVTVQPLVDSTAFGAENKPDLDGSVHAPN